MKNSLAIDWKPPLTPAQADAVLDAARSGLEVHLQSHDPEVESLPRELIVRRIDPHYSF